MSAPIGPGDWVEEAGAPADTPDWHFVEVSTEQTVWMVEAVGEWRGLGWIRCVGYPHPGDLDPAWRHVPGWDIRCFRPIYRPKSEMIEALKQPAPERALEDA